MSETAPSADLVDRAIGWIRQNALRGDRVDWDHVQARAQQRLAGSDAYTVIEEILRELGDGHSALRLRSRPHDIAEPSPTALPRVADLGEEIGLLELPAVSTHGEAAIPYPRTAHDGMRGLAHLTRWIVDLRANSGGNMWPMLLAAGPLLGDGDAGRFIYPREPEQRWGYEQGRVHLAGSAQLALEGALSPLHPRAVAVLTGPNTRSSGEAMTLAFRGVPWARSFGQATSGVPTCNRLHRLDENAAIALTVGWMADRHGNTFDGPIPPDEESDDAVASATRWLQTR